MWTYVGATSASGVVGPLKTNQECRAACFPPAGPCGDILARQRCPEFIVKHGVAPTTASSSLVAANDEATMCFDLCSGQEVSLMWLSQRERDEEGLTVEHGPRSSRVIPGLVARRLGVKVSGDEKDGKFVLRRGLQPWRLCPWSCCLPGACAGNNRQKHAQPRSIFQLTLDVSKTVKGMIEAGKHKISHIRRFLRFVCSLLYVLQPAKVIQKRSGTQPPQSLPVSLLLSLLFNARFSLRLAFKKPDAGIVFVESGWPWKK